MCLRFRIATNLIIVLLGVTICIMIFIITINNNDSGWLYALDSLEGELPELPIIYDSTMKAELVFQRKIEREKFNDVAARGRIKERN